MFPNKFKSMKKIITSIILLLITITVHAQTDTSSNKAAAAVFERIMSSVKEFKLDTTALPDDKITRKINQLRNLQGGFNINEAIQFKIAEDRSKNEIPQAELDRLATFFTSGNGKQWLDNAVTRIYRDHFTYKELKQLVRFYKTSAGHKLAADFPVIMLKSLMAAEMIKESYKAAGIKQN
jgi:uncharacterized protein